MESAWGGRFLWILGGDLGFFYMSEGMRGFIWRRDYSFTPLELYFTRKKSESPELVFPSSPPMIFPVT